MPVNFSRTLLCLFTFLYICSINVSYTICFNMSVIQFALLASEVCFKHILLLIIRHLKLFTLFLLVAHSVLFLLVYADC